MMRSGSREADMRKETVVRTSRSDTALLATIPLDQAPPPLFL